MPYIPVIIILYNIFSLLTGCRNTTMKFKLVIDHDDNSKILFLPLYFEEVY